MDSILKVDLSSLLTIPYNSGASFLPMYHCVVPLFSPRNVCMKKLTTGRYNCLCLTMAALTGQCQCAGTHPIDKENGNTHLSIY